MAVEKFVDLTATASTIDDAVAQAVHRASLTLQGLTGFEVQRIEGTIADGEPVYKVHVRISFIIKERLHE